jgi:hypothetical protein
MEMNYQFSEDGQRGGFHIHPEQRGFQVPIGLVIVESKPCEIVPKRTIHDMTMDQDAVDELLRRTLVQEDAKKEKSKKTRKITKP